MFDKDVVADVDYALQQVVRSGTGTKALALGRPAAGKTGTAALRPGTTTSAWFVGYTPQLAAAVDFYKGTGRADLDGVGGLSTFFGGEYPARVWTAFMTAALKNKPVLDFPAPAYVGSTVNPAPPKSPSPSESPSGTPSTVPPSTVPPTPPPTPTPPPPPASSPPPSAGAAAVPAPASS